MTDSIFLNETERILQQTVREFADREIGPRASAIDDSEKFPWENIKGIADLGLFGLAIESEYGGTGGGYKELCVVVEELAKACAATSVIYAAHLSLASQTILRFGTESQKRQFLPSLANGTKIAAFALSEPEAGSDVSGLATTALKRDDYYVLNGSKLFITNGDVAETIVVFATHDRSLRSKGIDCFIVENSMSGFTANEQGGKMGMKASTTAELVFQDCVVPEKNRLGDEGAGFNIAMQILESSRIAIAAQCVGIGQACLEIATNYARNRQAFGKHISDFQAIQWMIADMATEVDAARLLTRRAAVLKDQGMPHGVQSAMAKLFASEAANRAASKAVQICGGYGYFKGNPVERYYRDAKVTEIYEGTSEVQRLIIARGALESMNT